MNFKDCDDMKSDDEYIVKIRDLCSQQGIFSWKESSTLAFVFESLSGEPPDIHADRYRAEHHQELNFLDALEYQHQFLKRTEDTQFYVLSPYALPLVEVARAVLLLEIMECKIIQ